MIGTRRFSCCFCARVLGWIVVSCWCWLWCGCCCCCTTSTRPPIIIVVVVVVVRSRVSVVMVVSVVAFVNCPHQRPRHHTLCVPIPSRRPAIAKSLITNKATVRRASFKTASATANRQAVAYALGLQQSRALFASRLTGTLDVCASGSQWLSRHLVLDGVVLACWPSADACYRARQQRHRRARPFAFVAKGGDDHGSGGAARADVADGEKCLWTARLGGADVRAVVDGGSSGGSASSLLFTVRFAPSARSSSGCCRGHDRGIHAGVGAGANAQLDPAQMVAAPPAETVCFCAADRHQLKAWLGRLSQTARLCA